MGADGISFPGDLWAEALVSEMNHPEGLLQMKKEGDVEGEGEEG